MKRNKKTNSKKVNRVRILALAAVLTMGAGTAAGAISSIQSVPVYAATGATIAGTSGIQDETGIQKGTITVSGIDEEGATVKAYPLVRGYYNADHKLVKYVQVDPTNAPVAAAGDQTKGQTKDDDADNDTNDHNDIITYDEITKAANAVTSGTYGRTTDGTKDETLPADLDGIKLTKGDDGNYTASVAPGLYLILATSPANSNRVYNPGVAAVNVTNVNTGAVEGGTVDFTKYFTTEDGDPKAVSKVYLKSSHGDDGLDKKETKSIKLAKEAEDQTAGDNEVKVATGHGDTVAFGDTIDFEISGLTVPSFSKDYTAKHYYVTDHLKKPESFTGITNLVVQDVSDAANPKTLTAGTDYTLTAADGTGTYTEGANKDFRVTLTDNYLAKHIADATRPSLKITYETKLTGNADVNAAENNNHLELHYSNDPSDETGEKERVVKKDTYVYTFTIGGSIDAQSETGDEETHEFNKVTKKLADGESYVDGTATGNAGSKSGVATKKSSAPLAGATFTLYSDADFTTPVKARTVNPETGEVTTGTDDYTAVSDANGHISFAGLDDGTYYMKETNAPDGYTLSDAQYKFVISSELDSDTGVLKTYEIKTQYKSVEGNVTDWADAGDAKYTVTATRDENTGDVTNTVASDVTPVEIVDVRTQNLPSTGGIGLYLILGAAGGLTFAGVGLNKKKEKKNA